VLVAGEDHEEAPGLRPGGGDAGREARAGEAERGVEAQTPLELVAHRLRGARRGRVGRALGSEVDERLVGRGALDPSAGREKHGGDLFAEAAVSVEVPAAEDGERAQLPGPREGLARPDPGRARLLARRGHDAHAVPVAADDDRAPAEGRVEAPLDRDEERVEVDVQDASAPLPHAPSIGPDPAPRGPGIGVS
jgi:hypothetical protein